jgi:hypothetical protein
MQFPRVRTLLPIAALTLALGCGKSDETTPDKPSGERTKEPVPETPKDAPKGPFAPFDFAAAQARWQGAWVLGGDVIGKQVAWQIDGDTLVEFDGTRERKLKFTVYSPCQVTSTDEDEGVTSYTTFTFVGDQLHAGLGSAGAVVGDATIVCDGGKTYVLRPDGCTVWSEMFDDWKSEPSTCKIEGEGAGRKFTIDGREIGFLSETALGTAQMQGNVATKHPDFAAAKAALASAGAAP